MTAITAPAATSPSRLSYLKFELLRTFRARRFFIFSVVFPLVMFLLIAGPNQDAKLGGIALPVYFLGGMVAWGTMMAALSSGGRVSVERTVGWTRQLRITPLTSFSYFRAKVVTAYAMVLTSIALLYAAGIAMGVHLSARGWVTMTGLVLVGVIPFIAFGLFVGHLVSPDALGPVLGGVTAVLAVVGGAWGPIGGSALESVAHWLPSYWLVQAGTSAYTGTSWPLQGWICIALWSAVLIRLAATVYRRDTKRV
jgi:ABC-2 type transport system permease protein